MGYNGTREAFASAITELCEKDRRYQIISADSMKAARLTEFAKKYPECFVEVGIAEQCAVNVAAGLASAGLIPFVATYCGFLTMRACEQIRTFVAYPGLDAKFIGFNAGMLGGEREGVTHQFYEDIGIMRSIPGITIVCPADDTQVYQATKAVAETNGPCYMRLGSNREPRVFEGDIPTFELGKIRILRDYGNDVAVFTYGFVIDRAIKAADELKSQGIGMKLVEVHTINPLDVQGICGVLKKCGKAITFEDHFINGGLGSAIAEVIAQEVPAKLIRIGLTEFPGSGSPDDLLKMYGIDTEDIITAAKLLCNE
jgi:transketolase